MHHLNFLLSSLLVVSLTKTLNNPKWKWRSNLFYIQPDWFKISTTKSNSNNRAFSWWSKGFGNQVTQQKSLASLCKVRRQCWAVSTAASDGSRNQHALWHLCHLLCSLGSSGIASGSLAPFFSYWEPGAGETGTVSYFLSLAETCSHDLEPKDLK